MAKTAKKKPAAKKLAAKKPAAKKKLTLGKETVRKLTDQGMRKVPGQRAPDSYMTCNMKCNSDPSACGC